MKKVSTKKSRLVFHKENLSPNQRVYTDYDTEIIQKKKSLKGIETKISLSRMKKTLKNSSSSRSKLSKKCK